MLSRIVLTRSHRRSGGLVSVPHFLLVPEAGSPGSGEQQGRGEKEGPSVHLSICLSAFAVPRHPWACLLCPSPWPLLCPSLHPLFSPFRDSCARPRPPVQDGLISGTFSRDTPQQGPHIQLLGVAVGCLFGGYCGAPGRAHEGVESCAGSAGGQTLGLTHASHALCPCPVAVLCLSEGRLVPPSYAHASCGKGGAQRALCTGCMSARPFLTSTPFTRKHPLSP